MLRDTSRCRDSSISMLSLRRGRANLREDAVNFLEMAMILQPSVEGSPSTDKPPLGILSPMHPYLSILYNSHQMQIVLHATTGVILRSFGCAIYELDSRNSPLLRPHSLRSREHAYAMGGTFLILSMARRDALRLRSTE